jgi:hypothetical protein
MVYDGPTAKELWLPVAEQSDRRSRITNPEDYQRGLARRTSGVTNQLPVHNRLPPPPTLLLRLLGPADLQHHMLFD